MEDIYYLKEAYKEALIAKDIDEVPIGAVIVKDDKIIAKAHNTKEANKDVTCHAEINAIKEAEKYLNNWHLDDCILYVTLEPCLMCTGAIILSRIKKVVYGAKDLKGGALNSNIKLHSIKGLNHYPEIIYLEDEDCSNILKDYFRTKRNKS